MKDLISTLRPALLLLVVFTLLTGIAYPALMTAMVGGNRHGDLDLIGQPFDEPGYFWGRPSALAPEVGATNSSGSNGSLAAVAPVVAERVAALRAADPGNPAPVPVDLATRSASGLDPHISPAAAYYQVDRVARARAGQKLTPAAVRALVEDHIEGRTLGVLGEPRVNVLALNRALDALAGGPPK
jgi:K+-transporting ATPase ATPase C chain